MDSKRLYFVLLGVIALLVIGLFGGAYAANKLLISESNNLKHNRLQAAVLDAEEQQLSKAKADIRKYNDLAVIAKSVVPQDKDQAQTVRQIVDIAKANGITLSSVLFPNSALGAGTGAVASPSASAIKLSQLTPVKGLSGTYDLVVTVSTIAPPGAAVSYTHFISFLNDLEHNRRTSLISGITLQPSATDRSMLNFSLTLNEYIKP